MVKWWCADGLRHEDLAFLRHRVHVVARCQSRRRRRQNLSRARRAGHECALVLSDTCLESGMQGGLVEVGEFGHNLCVVRNDSLTNKLIINRFSALPKKL